TRTCGGTRHTGATRVRAVDGGGDGWACRGPGRPGAARARSPRAAGAYRRGLWRSPGSGHTTHPDPGGGIVVDGGEGCVTMSDWRDEYLDEIRHSFRAQRTLAERAIAQLNDDELLRTLGEEDNSVAVIMKHVGGNLRSRWTEPFTTDGEKPDRNRDGEF